MFTNWKRVQDLEHCGISAREKRNTWRQLSPKISSKFFFLKPRHGMPVATYRLMKTLSPLFSLSTFTFVLAPALVTLSWATPRQEHSYIKLNWTISDGRFNSRCIENLIGSPHSSQVESFLAKPEEKIEAIYRNNYFKVSPSLGYKENTFSIYDEHHKLHLFSVDDVVHRSTIEKAVYTSQGIDIKI